ncbi:unnamed protein product [Adineta ricciae]|uniref:Uncharacterized protein n=1 Tax=Adineta ricciae TaxID=249248 RepID=A0A814AJ48_ADIRI|nr:unnamed protein product [Adineta ricciae]CAF1009757.1 unnamed protein product [Adineta ricciae]
MSTAEERRQRILANSQARLAKLRDVTLNEDAAKIQPMAPVSEEAPVELLQRTDEILRSTPPLQTTASKQQSSSSSIFSTIASATNMMNTFTSSSQTKPTPEITKDTILVDKQHLLVLVLGILVNLLYSFYISSQSNFFFLVYFTACTCILTSRYYMMDMKHRTNVLITTAMMSGFKPELMKKVVLIYTLVCDAWVIFAFYFVSFSLTHVICSLLKN